MMVISIKIIFKTIRMDEIINRVGADVKRREERRGLRAELWGTPTLRD